jgi:hypothetical protein
VGPLVTVITPTTGNPLLQVALESVASQTYRPIQHLVIIDGSERTPAARQIIAGRPIDVIELPYATGLDGYMGHRIYGAGPYLAKGDLICFLDEDNWMDQVHVESLVEVLRKGNQWSFSLRKIVDQEGKFICRDDCESLGKWPSIISPEDYFVDVNCFMLPKPLAVSLSPICHRKFREPGVVEIDRMLTRALRQMVPRFESSYLYSMNYRVGSTPRSVQASFFLNGNATMAKRFEGPLPWSSATQEVQADAR